jgi:DNA-binding NarL/FixJ family response regulator
METPSPIRIIIADPGELIIFGVKAWLADVPGVTVVDHVLNGSALLERLKQQDADLVLMEVPMPGMDGIDTMRAVKATYPQLKVIAHTELIEIEFVNSMLIEGAAGYLVKGTGREEMLKAIHEVVNGRQYLSHAAQVSVDKGYRFTEKSMDGEYIGLTPREREIIRLVALDHSNDEIASILFVSVDTVKTHRKKVMSKLNVRSVAGLVRYARDRRWV